MKKSKFSTFFRFQNFQNHFSPRRFFFRFRFFSFLEIVPTSIIDAARISQRFTDAPNIDFQEKQTRNFRFFMIFHHFQS